MKVYSQFITIRKFTIIFFFVTLLSSCACLKTNISNNDRVILSESNLTLLNGKYGRKSIQQDKDSLSIGDLYWNLFANSYSFLFGNEKGLNIKSDVDFIEIKIVNKNIIMASYINENDTLISKIMKGKIKNGYFELKRKCLIISIIFTNLYRSSKFRIGLSNSNNLMADYKQISFGTLIILYPFYEKKLENDMEYKRIE